MKKIILLVTVCILIVSVFAGCSSGSSSSYADDYSPSYSSSLSEEDKFEIAETAILKDVYKNLHEDAEILGFDVDQTKYSIGSYDKEYGRYKVYGELKLYDKYGSFYKYGHFSGSCSVSDNGSISFISTAHGIDY